MRFSIGQKIFYGFSIIILITVSIILLSFPLLNKVDELSSQVLPLSREVSISQSYNEIVRALESKIELYLVLGSQDAKEEALLVLAQLDQFSNKLSIDKDLESLRGIRMLAEQISNAAGTLIAYINKKEAAYNMNRRLLETVDRFKNFEEAQKNFQNQKLK